MRVFVLLILFAGNAFADTYNFYFPGHSEEEAPQVQVVNTPTEQIVATKKRPWYHWRNIATTLGTKTTKKRQFRAAWTGIYGWSAGYYGNPFAAGGLASIGFTPFDYAGVTAFLGARNEVSTSYTGTTPSFGFELDGYPLKFVSMPKLLNGFNAALSLGTHNMNRPDSIGAFHIVFGLKLFYEFVSHWEALTTFRLGPRSFFGSVGIARRF